MKVKRWIGIALLVALVVFVLALIFEKRYPPEDWSGYDVLRQKAPNLPRPYRMWGYPVTPLAFGVVAFWFVINTIITTPGPSLIGLALVAVGIPVYYIWRRTTSHA